MISAQRSAMRSTPQPVSVGFPLKPNPGSDGSTTWKASPAIAAVGGRVGERTDHVEELDDRARPSVGEHERHGVLLR